MQSFWAHTVECEFKLIEISTQTHRGPNSIMQPWTPHLVFTVNRQGFEREPAIFTGSHFLNHVSLKASLLGAIAHTFWHDASTNEIHDDIVYEILRIVAWQVLARQQNWSVSFKGESLWALLTWGRLADHLVSLPLKGQKNSDWLSHFDAAKWAEKQGQNRPESTRVIDALSNARQDVKHLANMLANELEDEEQQEFQSFYNNITARFVDEWKHRCAFNER